MAQSATYTTIAGVTVDLGTNSGLSGDGSSGNKLSIEYDNSTIDVNSGTGALEAIGGIDPFTIAGSIVGTEISAPSAPAANGFVIYAQDNGAGKTQLLVKFSSGAAQQIAIQP